MFTYGSEVEVFYNGVWVRATVAEVVVRRGLRPLFGVQFEGQRRGVTVTPLAYFHATEMRHAPSRVAV